MAFIPDKLLADIRNFFDSTQAVNEEKEKEHTKFAYCIDIYCRYDDKLKPMSVEDVKPETSQERTL